VVASVCPTLPPKSQTKLTTNPNELQLDLQLVVFLLKLELNMGSKTLFCLFFGVSPLQSFPLCPSLSIVAYLSLSSFYVALPIEHRTILVAELLPSLPSPLKLHHSSSKNLRNNKPSRLS
jgi:hypothetical protein